MKKNKHCNVCGLLEEACLHSQNQQEDIKDKRVTRIVWFIIGFLSAIAFQFAFLLEP